MGEGGTSKMSLAVEKAANAPAKPNLVVLGPLGRFIELDQEVDRAEDAGLVARWDFGREVLARRVGKQLPRGLLDEIAATIGKSPREVQLRTRFAEQYPTLEQVRNAVSHFRSWHGLVGEGLTETPRLAPLLSSESVEWYTPKHIIDRVILTLGTIDLDPCADLGHNVPATTHYTAAGLDEGWRGRVYMNPPYGREIGDWVDKLADEYDAKNVTEAIALVPARTDTSWWAHLPAKMVCFVTGRLNFSDHENPAPFPSAVCYLGEHDNIFAANFIDTGLIYARLEVQ